MAEEQLQYVYVVGYSGRGLERVTDRAAGVEGRPLHMVTGTRGLVALVSPVAADRFGEEHLQTQLADLDRLEAIARAHHDVVDAAFAETTVLPMRLATVYRDETRVAAMLDEHHPRFEGLLSDLDGHVELGVKVYADPRPPQPEAESQAAPSSPGRAYLRRRRSERRTTQDAYRAATDVADAVARAAVRFASARAVHRPQQGEWSAGRGDNVANEAYLVPKQDVAAFGSAMGDLAPDTSGITVEVTGPWAPYSFASPADGSTPADGGPR